MTEEGSRLFVGNLSWGTTDQSLLEAFSGFEGSVDPTVKEAKVIVDRYSGRSRGFGFVTFDTAASAEKAMQRMNGVQVDGRAVRVDLASSQRN